jgi:hypothetical protein
MAHKIKTDLQIDTLAGAGTRPLAVDSSGVLIEQTATEKTEGTRIATIDMTNGGANNIQNIDITWQSSWDAYDFCEILVRGARNSVASQVAWVAYANGTPSTFLTLAGYSDEGVAWSSDDLPANTSWNGSVNMTLYSHQKILATGKSGFTIDANVKINAPNDSINGLYRCDYNGTSLTNFENITEHSGWYTGSAGFNGYTLRLAQEAGVFNNGIISIIGYKYP